MNRIRILLLANQALFRSSLCHLLASEHMLEVVGAYGDSTEALNILVNQEVRLVLLDSDGDLRGPGEFMAAARRSGYQGRFLVLTGTVDAGSVLCAIRAGASGIFLKSDAPERLVQAIHLVSDGGVWLDQPTLGLLTDQISRQPADDSALIDPMSEREQKVLAGILGGLTNKKIGENLGLSEATIKGSVQQLFFRAGVRRRSQLVRAAMDGTLGNGKPPNGRLAERLSV